MLTKIITVLNLIVLIFLSIISFTSYEKFLKDNLQKSAYRMKIASWLISIATGMQTAIVFFKFGGIS